MARKFASKEKREMEEILNQVLDLVGVYNIPPNAIRSIEEIAKLSRFIEGLGYGYLSRSQMKWLESGGYMALKKAKPYIAKLVKELMGKAGTFPVSLREVADRAQERAREKAKEGKIDKKWERIIITPAEVDSILRFKRDPYFSKGEKTRLTAEVLVEVLEEMKNPEVKPALEVAKIWLERFLRATGAETSQLRTRTE